MSADVTYPAAPIEALHALFLGMPPVLAMGARAVAYDGETLILGAPLAANLNDKGNAFGGSLSSLMTLSAWGLVMLRLRDEGLDGEVYVADSSVRYSAPLYGDLHAEARLDDPADWPGFLALYRRRGRARLSLRSCIRTTDGEVVSSLSGRFAALASK